MLRIKKNIDLKQLEKLGFDVGDYGANYWEYDFLGNGILLLGFDSLRNCICVKKIGGLEKLFDLIKAGYIEKIENVELPEME